MAPSVECSATTLLVVAECLELAKEAFQVVFILLDELGDVVFVLHEVAGLVKSELFELLDLFLTQRDSLRCEQFL